MKSASITLRINIQGIKKGKSYVIFAFINLNTAKIKPVHEAKYKIIHTGEFVDEVGLRRAITKWPYRQWNKNEIEKAQKEGRKLKRIQEAIMALRNLI